MRLSRRTKLQVAVALSVTVVLGAVYLIFALRPAVPPVGGQRVFQLGGIPHAIAATPDAVWVTDIERRLVMKVDPETGRIEAREELAFIPGELVVTDDSVWVGAIEDRSIARLDVVTAELVETIEIGLTPQSLTSGDERVWVAAFDEGVVQSLDASSGRLVGKPIRDKEAFFADLTWGFDRLWVADVVDDSVLSVGESGTLTEIHVGDSPTGIVAGEGSVWTSNFNASTVTRIDPETLRPGRPILIGGKPGGIATGAGYVWITRPEDDALVRIDAQAGSWTGEIIDVGADPQGVSVSTDTIWVANQGDGSISRIELTE